MIKKLSKAINTYLIHKSYSSFANFIVNNPTTGKPCA